MMLKQVMARNALNRIISRHVLASSRAVKPVLAPIPSRFSPISRYPFSTSTTTTDTTNDVAEDAEIEADMIEMEEEEENMTETFEFVEGGFKPRLEEHYYRNVLEDLLVLCYDHNSPNASLESLSTHPEWSTSYSGNYASHPSHLLTQTYSQPLHRLPTLPYEDYVTTSLLTKESASIGAKQATKGFFRPKTNIIDYTSVSRKVAKKADLHDPKIAAALANPLVTVSPFAPVISRIPNLKRISLKIFTTAAINNRMVLMSAFMSLQSITGVAPKTVVADFSDAKQRIRAGMPMGAKVDLIGTDMYSFLDKLTQIVLPRMREFKGLNPEMDAEKVGVYKFTLPQTAMGYFPDIEPIFDMYPRLFETEIEFVTTGQSEHETITLLSGFQLPFMPEKEVAVVEKSNEPEDPWAKFKRRQKKR